MCFARSSRCAKWFQRTLSIKGAYINEPKQHGKCTHPFIMLIIINTGSTRGSIGPVQRVARVPNQSWPLFRCFSCSRNRFPGTVINAPGELLYPIVHQRFINKASRRLCEITCSTPHAERMLQSQRGTITARF